MAAIRATGKLRELIIENRALHFHENIFLTEWRVRAIGLEMVEEVMEVVVVAVAAVDGSSEAVVPDIKAKVHQPCQR